MNYLQHRIKIVKDFLGLTTKKLATKAGIGDKALSAYETGQNVPSDKALLSLSEAAGFHRSFFLNNSPPESPPLISYRKLKSTPSGILKRTQSISLIYPLIINFLDNQLNFPKVEISKEKIDVSSLDDQNIEELALSLREKWNLGKAPIYNLTSILEKKGVFISSVEDLGDKVDAFSFWTETRPVILLSADKLQMKAVRLRLDLSHELFHLMYHHEITTEDIMNDEALHKKLEEQANKFAGAFLLPKETFLKDITDISFYNLAGIKKKWGVSIQAMIQRLYNLGQITSNQRVYLITRIKDRKNELFDEQIRPEKPVLINNAFKYLINNGITKDYISENTNLSIEHIINLTSIDPEIFQDKEDHSLDQFTLKNPSLSDSES